MRKYSDGWESGKAETAIHKRLGMVYPGVTFFYHDNGLQERMRRHEAESDRL